MFCITKECISAKIYQITIDLKQLMHYYVDARGKQSTVFPRGVHVEGAYTMRTTFTPATLTQRHEL